MKQNMKNNKNQKIICFLLLMQLLTVLVFGCAPEESRMQAEQGMGTRAAQAVSDSDVYRVNHRGCTDTDSRDFFEAVNAEAIVFGDVYGHLAFDAVKRILESGAMIFSIDLQGEMISTSDGKSMDWNVAHAGDYRCREQILEQDLTAQAPISDTENATRQNSTYIINKSIRKILRTGKTGGEWMRQIETRPAREKSVSA